MQVRFRVYGALTDVEEAKMMFTSEFYEQAEQFCWRYSGPLTLYIMKVWVSK